MIVKKIKHIQTDKPKEWQIGDLVDYIRNPDVKNRGEKIEYAGSRNFITDTHVAQKLEMISLARETVRSKMPVNHWLFSWPEGEQPTRAQVDELVDIFLDQMGLKDHQAIYALHCDTRNYHVHIAVNRVHPDTMKVVRTNKGFDIRQAHKIRAFIEKKQGWSELSNAPYIITEEGELAKREVPKEIKPSPKAQEFEHRTGEKSAQRIAQERGHEIIKNANSWQELHEGLKKIGLKFEKKGSGAIIWIDNTAIKASSVDRAFSMGKLCKKLGEFEAGNYENERPTHGAEPLYPALLSEWQKFRNEVKNEKEQREETEAKKEKEIILLKKKQARERLEKLARLAKYGLPILNIARHCLKIEHARQLKFLLDRFKATLPDRIKKRFPEWLKERGYAPLAIPASTKIAEEKNRHTRRPAIQPKPSAPSPQHIAFLEYAKAVNADRYRVTVIRMDRDGSRKVFILDKKDGQSMGFTPDELVQKMPELLKLQNRGENIYYTPLSEGKHHILIDDVSPENVLRLQKDGYKPAAIIESSPRNFQCILTIPKFDGEFDRQIANQLTAMLNRKYGDPNLSGAIHPHRAPGFENRKPKHRRENGSYPLVLLRYAIQQICRKAIVEARRIEQTLTMQAAERRKSRQVYVSFNPGNPQQAYFAHYENIRSHLTIEDFSRVDAMIALRMRANGHSPESVLAAIRDCAPAIRDGTEKRRNWPVYAERTMNYAFGYAGDRDLLKNKRYIGLWQHIEKIKNYQTKMKITTR